MLMIGCPVLSTTACGNRYQSKKEAEIACDEWSEQGDYVMRETQDSMRGFGKTRKQWFRWCWHEKETKQILGWEYQNIPSIQDKATYDWEDWKDVFSGKGKIVNNSRY